VGGIRVLRAVDAFPAAVEVVEAVVLLVDDDDVLHLAQLVRTAVAVTRRRDRAGGERQHSHRSYEKRQEALAHEISSSIGLSPDAYGRAAFQISRHAAMR
jgi:hypothetical protein